MKTIDVAAVDVGYDSTKFSTGMASKTDFGRWACPARSFQSLAVIAPNRILEEHADPLRRSATLRWNGESYLTGDQAIAASTTGSSRVLDPSYIHTDDYMIFVCEALEQMGARGAVVNTLVLGAPVDRFQSSATRLKERFTGPVPFNDGEAYVKSVKCFPQPLGGLVWANANNDDHTVGDLLTLVVDPGYGTLDWLVAKSNELIVDRCGAKNAGMSKIIDAVIRGVSNAEGRNVTSLMLEQTIRKLVMARGASGNDKPESSVEFRVGASLHNIDNYTGAIDRVINDGISDMLRSIGGIDDIERIVVVGGGAHLYASMLKSRTRRSDIEIVSDSTMNNVRGFQLLGQY
jgi:plasmid segregation protein ParM